MMSVEINGASILTFHDPNGSGKVFHVFVNMQQEQVARTFYTRSRPERSAR